MYPKHLSILSRKFNLKRIKKFRSSFQRHPFLFIIFLLIILIVHYSGLLLYILQSDLENSNENFIDKPNLTNIIDFYHQRFINFSMLEELKKEANRNFDIKTLTNNFDQRFLIENSYKCLNKIYQHEDIRLLILIKSALANRQKRDILRKSWANEKRFSDVEIRNLFSIGSCDDVNEATRIKLDIEKTNSNCQDLIDKENELYGDLIQIDFIDTYYNNTIKTLNGIKWVMKNCVKAQFILLVDDDYYLSIKNLLKHIRWLDYSDGERDRILKQISYIKNEYEKSLIINQIKRKFNTYTKDLYMGWVFNSSVPCRYRFSKWFIDLDEYPFSKWPKYISAGFLLLSNRSLRSIYFASLYTKIFRFDDIYLSILTRKVGIRPVHNQNVHFYKLQYTYDGLEYKDVISSHGFEDTNEMFQLWMLMKSKGFA